MGAADREILLKLRQAAKEGPEKWPHRADWNVRTSEEDWYNRHTNQGAYARRSEDAIRTWGWGAEELVTVAVAYERETFAGEQLRLLGDQSTGIVACSRL